MWGLGYPSYKFEEAIEELLLADDAITVRVKYREQLVDLQSNGDSRSALPSRTARPLPPQATTDPHMVAVSAVGDSDT